MFRWITLILCWCLLLPVFASIEIIDVPETLDDQYDLTWELTLRKTPTAPLLIQVEGTTGRDGYMVTLEKGRAVWQHTGDSLFTPVSASCKLDTGKRYLFSLKRRPGAIALLCDHRLVLSAPLPTEPQGSLEIRQVPAGIALEECRYQPVESPRLGDDFMRPEALKRLAESARGWVEDDTWKTAFYQRDNPAEHLKPGDVARNPWQLSLFRVAQTTTNGFWFLYTGVGPSWVVANPTMVYPSLDRYFFEAAVKPEYGSEVGIIAAYQDNKNYLFFRWKARDARDARKAELVAIVDGKQTVLAFSPNGFAPGQWYTLRINLDWRQAQALVDGAVLLQATNPGPVEGRVGLYANGVANPEHPKLDDITATMYVVKDEATGETVNDAADAMRTTSCIYFDDVRLGEWSGVDTMMHTPYQVERTGKWVEKDGIFTATAPGRLVTGLPASGRYVATARVQAPRNGSAGLLFHLDREQTGYAWVLSPQGQKLQPLERNSWLPAVDTSPVRVTPGSWVKLRIEADGPYVRLFCDDRQVMEHYDATRVAGRCGYLALAAGAAFRDFAVTPLEDHYRRVAVHDGFDQDKWLVIWSSAESDWYPAFSPKAYVTPAGLSHQLIGAAAPLPTDVPGLYWNKGGYYHDLRVTIPVSRETLNGQTLHLSTNYKADAGYRLRFTREGGDSLVTLLRNEETVGTYRFTLTQRSQLLFERRGSYLLLRAQTLDPDDDGATPSVLREQTVFAYRDTAPLRAEMLGFTVTSPALPAAKLVVEADRIQDTFEQAPVGWIAQSGVWAVMNRYSCQPQWNWFGGFGAGAPTVWSKYRLEGDQTVEVYMGVKMQYDNMPEQEAKRFRDMNVTICADGEYVNSGYTVMRAARPNGTPVTLLLRKGVVVQRSTKPEHLLPISNDGHRKWYATRMEKRGGEIQVYIDNRLAMSYVDPEPLTGGYTAFWTMNNGIMIGRANISAERMSLGAPVAAVPLVMQEKLDPRPTPRVVQGKTAAVATFEDGLNGWQERPGFTGRLVRERVKDPKGGENTYLKVVNTYPAGDFSATLTAVAQDFAVTPYLHLEYAFDPGTKVNLYVRRQQTWYEVVLTGEEALDSRVYTAGRSTAQADGQWHHLAIDMKTLLTAALTAQTGRRPVDLRVQEIIIADWSVSSELRYCGFGANPGGRAIRFDNVALSSETTSPFK